MNSKQNLTPYQSQYYAWLLTRHIADDSVESLASTLVDAQIDLNPHQVEAALFACHNPLSRGVILADEVGLGKTIEAGLVILQHWAERQRKVLIIVPANLRKQWYQELQDKFGLQSRILESRNYKKLEKQTQRSPFLPEPATPIICSYQFAKAKALEIKEIHWDLVVFDEAHRLRNVYKNENVIARTIRDALSHVNAKMLLTATPLQNSLLELYGLVSIIDEKVFGDEDSFRAQFCGKSASQTVLQQLKTRLKPVCKRTLRCQVQAYVSYTSRKAIVQEYTPSEDERILSEQVANYLRKPHLQALPNDGARQLVSLVLWKLLASSTYAIAGALETMAMRLQKALDEDAQLFDLAESLNQNYESLNETRDEWDMQQTSETPLTPEKRATIATEIHDLKQFHTFATHIRDNAKGAALLTALNRAFQELERLGAAKKAIIFTESRRTQNYLWSLLEKTPYGQGLMLFNGENNDARAKEIYQNWLVQYQNTDRITGSKTADTRSALVEYFQTHGTVMIATEAGSEGINLQFCSLVINYDLPWNPQRIEQRIGRCHRYGQQFDVVVVNFVDRSNEADARVYELLEQKFQLFNGVFGASDEVLGAIGSGIDFERRIVNIYQNCRNSAEIEASFTQLREDLSSEINAKMAETRQLLIEHFDEEVQERLRLRAEDSKQTLHRFERMLMEMTQAILPDDCAEFDECGFYLHRLPADELSENVLLGRYELPRRHGNAHLYRIGHPLAVWVIEQAKAQSLPTCHLSFDYAAYDARISTLEVYRGQSGWLSACLLQVDALGDCEEHLIVAAHTADGRVLEADDPEKLLRLPATVQTSNTISNHEMLLTQELEARKQKCLDAIGKRNLMHFQQESEKLEHWVDDLKLGLEENIKEIDREIKQVRRAVSAAPTLEEKLGLQKQQRELENKRRKLREALYERQDAVEAQCDQVIGELEQKLVPQVQEKRLFTIEWSLL